MATHIKVPAVLHLFHSQQRQVYILLMWKMWHQPVYYTTSLIHFTLLDFITLTISSERFKLWSYSSCNFFNPQSIILIGKLQKKKVSFRFLVILAHKLSSSLYRGCDSPTEIQFTMMQHPSDLNRYGQHLWILEAKIFFENVISVFYRHTSSEVCYSYHKSLSLLMHSDHLWLPQLLWT
jgi:hypothetical protein